MSPWLRNTDRQAKAALRDAMERLPSTMARLVFLSGVRDSRRGAYRALAASEAERPEVDHLWRRAHEEAFSAWLNYSLEKKKADLDLYFSHLNCCRAAAAGTWLRLGSYRSLAPVSAGSLERRLFCGDLEALLRLIGNEDLDPSAAPPMAPNLQQKAIRPGTLLCALRCSGTGISDLSARELEVLKLIGQGKASKEIAELLCISETTVSEYRKRICKKLALHSTAELAACVVGWLSGTCRLVPPG